LFGELDACSVPRVRECLVQFDGDVDLDCSGLSFIDAAGIGLFLQVHADCQARSAKLLIVDPSRCVLRLLEISGLDSVLAVEPRSRAL
jgi:anti-anti-sigma factor